MNIKHKRKKRTCKQGRGEKKSAIHIQLTSPQTTQKNANFCFVLGRGKRDRKKKKKKKKTTQV